MVTFEVVKTYWNRYNPILFIILTVYCLYKTFAPAEVKIIQTEHIRNVIDRSELSKVQKELAKLDQLRQQVESMSKQVTEQLKNIQVNEVIKETKKPDGTVETTTERVTVDKTVVKDESTKTNKEDLTKVSESSETVKEMTAIKEHKDEVKDTKKEITQNPNSFWFTMFSFKYFTKEIELGQGINFSKNLSVGVVGSYRFDNQFDVGGAVFIRY